MAVFHLFLIILIYFNVLLLAKSIFFSFLYNLIYLYIKSPFFSFDILKDLN